jgi:hypothetical protein
MSGKLPASPKFPASMSGKLPASPNSRPACPASCPLPDIPFDRFHPSNHLLPNVNNPDSISFTSRYFSLVFRYLGTI